MCNIMQIILDNSSIAIHYLKTWLIIDIISTFPFDVIYIRSLNVNRMTDVQKIYALR